MKIVSVSLIKASRLAYAKHRTMRDDYEITPCHEQLLFRFFSKEALAPSMPGCDLYFKRCHIID